MRVHLWDVATHRPLAVLAGHQGHQAIDALAFSPDGKLLVSKAGDKTLRLWDVTKRFQIAALAGETSTGHSLAFSPDGKLLATGAPGGLIRLWSLARPGGRGGERRARQRPRAGRRPGRPVAMLPGHKADVLCLAFSPDGNLLASGGQDNTIRLWEMATKREVTTLWGHEGPVNAVAFSPDGKTLATGSGDSTIKLWDAGGYQKAGGQALTTLRIPERAVLSLAFAPDGRTLASGSVDGMVRLWDATTRGATSVIRQTLPVYALAFSPDGRALAAGSAKGSVKLWDLPGLGPPPTARVPAGRQETTLEAHTGDVNSLAFSPDGKLLALGSKDPTVQLWKKDETRSPDQKDRPSGTPPPTRPRVPGVRWRRVASLRGCGGGLRAVAFSADGKTLASQTSTSVRMWDVADDARAGARLKLTLQGLQLGSGFAFSPDGRSVAADSEPNSLTLFDLETRSGVALAQPSLGPLAFSPDGKTLAVGFGDGVGLWDVAAKRSIAALKGHSGPGGDLVFSPDGQSLVSCSGSTVSVWNLRVRQEALTFTGHTGTVQAVAFSPDGNALAAADDDGTVRLWRAAPVRETELLRADALPAARETPAQPVPLLFQEAGAPAVTASGANQAVRLQWEPVPHALGYQVYRGSGVQVFRRSGVQELSMSRSEGPNARTPERLSGWVKLTPQPITATTFTDRGPGLVNGQFQTYAVGTLFPGSAMEPRATVLATPVAAPPGFLGSSIGEDLQHGSVRFDPERYHHPSRLRPRLLSQC
jgi:WD40 repeat protein